MPNDKKSPRPLKKIVDTSHYAEYLPGTGHDTDNKVIRAKNTLSDAQAFSDSVYNQAQDKKQSFKRGGRVKKTGMAKVHKGEHVLTRNQVRNMASKLKM